MSEYEETDSLTLAVADAIQAAGMAWLDEREGQTLSDSNGWWYVGWADVPDEVFARAAIKAYELHHEPALTAEEVAKITQAVHYTIGSPAVFAKVEDGNALLRALRRRDLP